MVLGAVGASKEAVALEGAVLTGKSSGKVVLMAVAGNGTLAIGKFFVWLVNLSPSMLAEAIHSLADTSNQVLLYIGIKHGQYGPTQEYPWGRTNARYLWNLVSAVGIFFIGFGVTVYHGIYSLVHLEEGYQMDKIMWTIGVLVAALVVEGIVFFYAARTVNKERKGQSLINYIRKGDDPTNVAVFLEDGIAILGVLIAFIGIGLSIYYQSGIPDAVASIVIGILLGFLAIILARANGRLLIGVSAPLAEEKKIRQFLEEHPSVERVIQFRTEILGPDMLRLATEIEFHGEVMINREQMIKDAEKIRSGEEDALPVLVDSAGRMVRTVGNEINDLERKLKLEFPQLSIIELEVN